MTFLSLFWSFFQVGLFSIGGGYATMPLIQQQIVEIHGWLSMAEFADVIAISQMTPGPISINSATFVGMRIAGLPGALVATFGCVLPSLIIVLTLARLYYRYRTLSLIQGVLGSIRPAVVAMIGSACVSILILVVWNSAAPSLDFSSFDFIAIGLCLASFIALRAFKLKPTLVMLSAGVAGVGLYYLFPALA